MTFPTVLFTHFLADFVYQSREIATTKSSNNISLLKHVAIYAGVLGIATAVDIGFAFFGWPDKYKASIGKQIAFIIFNVVMHFVTDYFTSRASTKAYKTGDLHRFWCVIGFDQMIHATTLYWSWKAMTL